MRLDFFWESDVIKYYYGFFRGIWCFRGVGFRFFFGCEKLGF